jgi:predicted nucleotidyltransferase
VIEYPIIDEFDFSGWDLRKTLALMNKSNPMLFEWLVSPIVYYKDEFAYTVLNELSKDYFSPISSVYHYLHMARRNYREYLQAEQVKVKKYFYVLHPILAALWIKDYQESPPMTFEVLLKQVSDKAIRDPINALLERKRAGVEFDLEPRNEALNDFIEKTIKDLETGVQGFDPHKKPGQEPMEKVFIEILDRVFSGPNGRLIE